MTIDPIDLRTINAMLDRGTPAHDDSLVVQTAASLTRKLPLHRVVSSLPGLLENKAHVAKIDDTHFSIAAGAAKIRKADGSLHEVSWDAPPSVDITTLNGGALQPGQLRWIGYKWNTGEAAIEPVLLPLLPTRLVYLDQIALVGRLWNTAGVLTVSSRHIRLSYDPYAALSGVSWHRPALNVRNSVIVSPHVSPSYLNFSAGELARWPIVTDHVTGSHLFEYPGMSVLTSIWGHLKATSIYDNITDCTAFNLLGFWDSGAGTPTAIDTGKYVVHRIGIYAGSNERVWFRGQAQYGSMEEAVAARLTEAFTYAAWAADARQIAPVAFVIARKNEGDFAANGSYCKILPWTEW